MNVSSVPTRPSAAKVWIAPTVTVAGLERATNANFTGGFDSFFQDPSGS